MAIKVTRICDLCNAEHKQINTKEKQAIVEYSIGFTCSDCILSIGRLKGLEAEENGEIGISCVRSIIFNLEHGNKESAQMIYQHDGDKIRAYPKIQQWCLDYFGCRIHLDKQCKQRICLDLCK